LHEKDIVLVVLDVEDGFQVHGTHLLSARRRCK
jgi:hypothetical protein